jgi:hypothetical protein
MNSTNSRVSGRYTVIYGILNLKVSLKMCVWKLFAIYLRLFETDHSNDQSHSSYIFLANNKWFIILIVTDQ